MSCSTEILLIRFRLSRLLSVLILLCAWTPVNAQLLDRPLRILSYNIHHGEGVDGVVDLNRQASVINSCSPDLVALQEVDDRTERTGNVDQTARFAELTGLRGRFIHQLDFEGGRYGQAILSRFPVSEVTLHWLPGMPDRERRIVGTVEVQLDDLELTFATTHLHHNNENFRLEQSRRLNELFAAGKETPNSLVVLVGDFNAIPDSQPLKTLDAVWQSATAGQSNLLTFPAAKPERQLDYILWQPKDRFKVLSAKVLNEPVASDHRPLFAEIALQ